MQQSLQLTSRPVNVMRVTAGKNKDTLTAVVQYTLFITHTHTNQSRKQTASNSQIEKKIFLNLSRRALCKDVTNIFTNPSVYMPC